MKRVCTTLLVLLTVICLTTANALALQIITEARIESTTAAPVKEELTFSGQGFEGFVLKVQNGDENGANKVSSAIVNLNDIKVISPSDFNQKVQVLERSIIPLETDNILTITLRSNPGGSLHIQVLGEPTLNLPPDPGPAGDATLEGVDANENGVRDDIERWIGMNYADSEKTRQALTQAFYPFQNFMLHARQGDRDAVYNDMTAMQRSSECLHYIRPDDAYLLVRELKAQVINTSQRVYAYRDSSRMLGGGSFPSAPFSKWNQSCTFDPDALDD